MAFSELVKSFEKIRGYMREFYVYGFRTRSGFSGKSGRTYDNERRRLECVLGEHTESTRDFRGKNVFLSIDSRSCGIPDMSPVTEPVPVSASVTVPEPLRGFRK